MDNYFPDYLKASSDGFEKHILIIKYYAKQSIPEKIFLIHLFRPDTKNAK